jgi:hypothetical protein
MCDVSFLPSPRQHWIDLPFLPFHFPSSFLPSFSSLLILSFINQFIHSVLFYSLFLAIHSSSHFILIMFSLNPMHSFLLPSHLRSILFTINPRWSSVAFCMHSHHNYSSSSSSFSLTLPFFPCFLHIHSSPPTHSLHLS